MSLWGSNSSSKRRDKLYIIAEILEIARDGVLKTQIMYKANLSFTQLNEYIRFMSKNELLSKAISDNKEVYKSSAKGLNFLQRYHEIKELLKTENENYRNNVKIPPPHILKTN
jgi:predicted transcriptional regulator